MPNQISISIFQSMKKLNKQSGQTLIETLVAIFILVMGISSALGLATYSLNASTSVNKQLIGLGLAREGIEAVKNMRDTNWLQGTLSTDCYNYNTATATASCYRDWLSATFCINPTNNNGNCNGSGVTQYYSLSFDSSTNTFWNLSLQRTSSDFGLNFVSDASTGKGFYTNSNGVDCTNTAGRSDYCRKITITKDTAAPYNQDVGPQVIVLSQVWWKDKKCPVSADWPGSGKCSIQLQMYLTNWKNY